MGVAKYRLPFLKPAVGIPVPLHLQVGILAAWLSKLDFHPFDTF
jgi:hypothetical protein